MDEISTRRAAHEDLQYIRRTLAAAGHISTVPGRGLAAIGVLALAAVWAENHWMGGSFWLDHAASPPPDDGSLSAQFGGRFVHVSFTTLGLWFGLFLVSLVIGGWAMRTKAARTGQVFWSPVLRKALWGYGAAILLGVVLTFAVLTTGRNDLLPEIWLGCYGVALVAAGSHSVAPVRWMGLCFLVTALAAAVTGPAAGLTWLALGFGWVHIAFGAYIAWRHDG